MSLFNTHGVMNASSLNDAIQTISKYASFVQSGLPTNIALSGAASLTDERKDDLISRAIMTQDGKMALAQAMANPIR